VYDGWVILREAWRSALERELGFDGVVEDDVSQVSVYDEEDENVLANEEADVPKTPPRPAAAVKGREVPALTTNAKPVVVVPARCWIDPRRDSMMKRETNLKRRGTILKREGRGLGWCVRGRRTWLHLLSSGGTGRCSPEPNEWTFEG
jgi:hypothetical protein